MSEITQGPPAPGTLGWLAFMYQTTPRSGFDKLRYQSRMAHAANMRRITNQYGHWKLADIKRNVLLEWHDGWSGGGEKVAMGHALIAQVRSLANYGDVAFENEACARLAHILSKMKFAMPAPRQDFMEPAQAVAIRKEAHLFGIHSIALAQAFQFECMLRQRDVIGQWVPVEEPGETDISHPRLGKWLRGIRWEEIDSNMVLRHVTSKKLKVVEWDLKLSPMVCEELELYRERRGALPTKGAVIIDERSGYPWKDSEFRRRWRMIATEAGVPKTILSMDSRSGGITEATMSGASIEFIKHAATHANMSTTERYARNKSGKIRDVQQKRIAGRGKVPPGVTQE